MTFMKYLMARIKILPLIYILFLNGCDYQGDNYLDTQFHVFLIAGQSNTHFGLLNGLEIQESNEEIFQLGRHEKNDFKIIKAIESLDHHTRQIDRIGFGLTFATLYKAQALPQIKVLLIPCGHSNTGFKSERWNPGNDLYLDAVRRVNYVLDKYPNSTLHGILWHQGESDVSNENFKYQLRHFIVSIRNDLRNDSVPLIMGGFVPYWVGNGEKKIFANNIIKEMSHEMNNVGYADPTEPYILEKLDDDADWIHFDAAGQREMGRRYFNEYIRLDVNN